MSSGFEFLKSVGPRLIDYGSMHLCLFSYFLAVLLSWWGQLLLLRVTVLRVKLAIKCMLQGWALCM